MNTLTLSRFTESPPDTSYDCIIIGGGITGAALAYEASGRGLSVALIEKNDFGSATSAATGKLIHGGLRYLKQLEFKLVRESLKERRVLSNIAPNFIYPYPIVLPDAGWLARVGLTLYDTLSFGRNKTWDSSKQIPRHRKINRLELKKAMPACTAQSGLLYYDCMCISPDRLTLAFLKSAAAKGAHVANYTEAQQLILTGNTVSGVTVFDKLTKETLHLHASVVVNASGPWTHDVLNKTSATEAKLPTIRSEGIYLVTKKLTHKMMLYVGEHGHFSFAPWREHSLIGPTETPYYGSAEDWSISKKSILDFINLINEVSDLPEPLTLADIKFAYGGLRPLSETESEDTYNASRSSELWDHDHDGVSGLITAAGGKYTTSRHFATQIMELVEKKTGNPVGPPFSEKQHLYSCKISNVEQYIEQAVQKNTDFNRATMEYLVRHYGTDYPAVLDIARENPMLAEPLNSDGEIAAQALFAIRYEMARSLTDIFLRRTGIGSFGLPADKIIRTISTIASTELSWSEAKLSDEIEQLVKALEIPR